VAGQQLAWCIVLGYPRIPPVRRRDGGIEFRVRVRKPLRASVKSLPARLPRTCRFVTRIDWKATRNALTDRWPGVSLNRRDGSNF
ncbi:MAG: hypothetical protein OXF78_07305, partial [Rhodospirillales bacterium]|nr:hypothetical protein [Rhodospirillales bacterium]